MSQAELVAELRRKRLSGLRIMCQQSLLHRLSCEDEDDIIPSDEEDERKDKGTERRARVQAGRTTPSGRVGSSAEGGRQRSCQRQWWFRPSGDTMLQGARQCGQRMLWMGKMNRNRGQQGETSGVTFRWTCYSSVRIER